MSKRAKMLKRNKARRLDDYRRILTALFTAEEIGTMSDSDIVQFGSEYRREAEAEASKTRAGLRMVRRVALRELAIARRAEVEYRASVQAKRLQAMQGVN